EQLRAFYASMTKPRDPSLLAVMHHYGLRVGEVERLVREDVDLARRRLLVRRLKGGHPERVGALRHHGACPRALLGGGDARAGLAALSRTARPPPFSTIHALFDLRRVTHRSGHPYGVAPL